jgi:hypothetical protein
MTHSSLGSNSQRPAVTPAYRVRAVNPNSESDSRAAARLHRDLFQQIGPIAQLGERLLQHYCYGYLLRSGLMKAVFFEIDDEPVGLAAYTCDSTKLQRAALRSHLPFVTVQALLSLIERPALIAKIPAAARLLWERHREKLPQEPGRYAEITAFGVLTHGRTREFRRSTHLRIADLLLDFVVDDLRAQGVSELRGVVLASNKPVIAFARRFMTRMDPFPSAQPSLRFWLDLTQAKRPPE